MVTKILTLNTITTAFHPSQSTVPPLGMQNTILLLNDILILKILKLNTSLRYFYHKYLHFLWKCSQFLLKILFSSIFTINTFTSSRSVLLILLKILFSSIYSKYTYKLPRNYPLIPIYPVQPSYPAKCSDYADNYRLSHEILFSSLNKR